MKRCNKPASWRTFPTYKLELFHLSESMTYTANVIMKISRCFFFRNPTEYIRCEINFKNNNTLPQKFGGLFILSNVDHMFNRLHAIQTEWTWTYA